MDSISPPVYLLRAAQWMSRVRFVLGLVFLVTMSVIRFAGWLEFPYLPFVVAPLAAMFINQPYLWLIRRVKNPNTIFITNLCIDIVIITYGAHYVGGMNMFAAIAVYPLTIIFSGILLSPFITYLMANLCALAYGVLVYLEYQGLLPVIGASRPEIAGELRLLICALLFPMYNSIAFCASYLVSLPKTIHQELEAKTAELQKVNTELDRFVYTVSHDLKAPLRGVTGFLSILERDLKEKLDDNGKDLFGQVVRNAAQMRVLIDDLVELSRISRIKNPYEYVAIGGLLADLKDKIQHDLFRGKITFTVDDKLPVIRCDRIKMATVFQNLVGNAIKFSSRQTGRNPRVDVGYREKEDSHVFFVKDNGIGIDPKDHQKVFQMFKRLHAPEEYEGTGAGLHIAEKIIEEHGGRLWIESELGRGATFYFSIPKTLPSLRVPD